jgi:hypothetical protein
LNLSSIFGIRAIFQVSVNHFGQILIKLQVSFKMKIFFPIHNCCCLGIYKIWMGELKHTKKGQKDQKHQHLPGFLDRSTVYVCGVGTIHPPKKGTFL